MVPRWMILFWISASCVFADGGVLIGKQTWGTLEASVFGAPAPLMAGPAEIEVLVQENGKPVLDAGVSVRWTSEGTGVEWLPPCCSMKTDPGAVPARTGHSGNNLLYAAPLTIPFSGPGKLDLRVEHGGREFHGTLELSATPPPSPASRYWPWLAMTPLAIAGFVIHQHITRRKGSGGMSS